jgi:hypothetical protein
MQEAFDPYYKWLAIPPADQPPNHYRLLGVQLFERDLDVIEAAADQRMAHLRAFKGGSNVPLAQRLLNEVAAAKVCLLDPRRREPYDRQLRGSLPQPPRAIPVAPPIVHPPTGVPMPPRPVGPRLGASPVSATTPQRFHRQASRMVTIATAAALALVICGWLATTSWRQNERTMPSSNEAPHAVRVRPSDQRTARKPRPSPGAKASPSTSRGPAPDTQPAKGTPDTQPGEGTLAAAVNVPSTSASPEPVAGASATTTAAFQLPKSTAEPVAVKSWFAIHGADDVAAASEEAVCSTDRSLKTALTWARSPKEAADEARRQGKLVFLIHVSGNFEDPGFT